ncbi:hypothetical protein APX70_200459 [Pseudomonas syringae pv. maculicola]|uniref:Uncharacterized protein n=1 Tax=Pseudomonas syringae pv. maculicola TaxID=59511 RepID=A0A3M2YIP6_PSEYM|nr:hypothetical protein APX70_200459 [Pseudomonas syringae pv. maculicola]
MIRPGNKRSSSTGSSGLEATGSRDRYSSATMISVRLSTVARMRWIGGAAQAGSVCLASTSSAPLITAMGVRNS